MRDDEQDAAAKSDVAQAKPHEKREGAKLSSALPSCLRFSVFFFCPTCKHTDSQRYYTDRGALSRPGSSDRERGAGSDRANSGG